MSAIERLNEIVKTTNTTDFRIQSYDSVNLMLTGSFDFCYYHEVELVFSEVSYISLPSHFWNPFIRMATDAEIAAIRAIIAIDETESVYCIEAETGASLEKLPFYIVAESVSIKEGLVYYYARENLEVGERIASWVKIDDPKS
jgi:hypothetical protein